MPLIPKNMFVNPDQEKLLYSQRLSLQAVEYSLQQVSELFTLQMTGELLPDIRPTVFCV